MILRSSRVPIVLALVGAALAPLTLLRTADAAPPSQVTTPPEGDLGVLYVEIPPLGLEAYARHCSDVVHATVQSVAPVFPESGMPYTRYKLSVHRSLKHATPESATLKVGGVDDGARRLLVPQAPRFAPGEEVVLFVARHAATGDLGLLGLEQGTYRVVERDGQRRITGAHASGDERVGGFLTRLESLVKGG